MTAYSSLGMSPILYDYYQKISVSEADILRQLREKTAALPKGHMQSSPEQMQLYQLLIHLTAAKRILDVGTYTGYSALAAALALQEGGEVITCDVDPECTQIAQRYWELAGVVDRIQLRLAPALETMQQLQAAAYQFDIIYIDADKLNYSQYYEQALGLVRQGGLILIDNVLWYGKVADESVQDKTTRAIRQFNERLHKDERIVMSMLPMGDGMTLALKK